MYQVDKSVPIPKSGRNSVYPFATLEVGDSFFIPLEPYDEKKATSIRACASTFAKRRGVTFTCKRVDGGLRVWRTS